MKSKVFPRSRETSDRLWGSLGRTVIALCLLLFGCSPEPRYKTLPASYWLKKIQDRDTANRYQAAHALGEMGPYVEGATPALVKAHANLDRAAELCYRPQPFDNDRQRVEHLFTLYEKLTAPLIPPAKKGRRKKRAAQT